MTRIGIIIDKYHLENKVTNFIKYLKSKAEVNIYLEEVYLLNSANYNIDDDLVFVKGKTELLLNLVKLLEFKTKINVINSFRGIYATIHRFLNSLLLDKAGVPVPRYSLNPVAIVPPFDDFISKNIIDQKVYAFKPRIDKKEGHLRVHDERALNESAENNNFMYYQEFIKSKWEYKVYGVGEQLFYYKQLPTLVDPDKMKSRQPIDRIPELDEISHKAMESLDLKIVSIDYMKNKGTFYLTDINSIPNFNYMKNGHKIVADYLIYQAKK